MGLLFEVLIILLCIFLACYLYTTQQYNYWKERGVPHVKPTFPFGSINDLVWGKRHLGDFYQQLYVRFKNKPFFGIYEISKPVLIVKDPKLVKLILTKDFQHFVNRFEIPTKKKLDYISNHLFNMTGHEWKQMRSTLTPTFSSGKMKLMFSLMLTCSEQLKDCLSKHITTNPMVNIKDLLARFTLDIIATCAFGLETNCLKEEDCEFYKVSNNVFKPSVAGFLTPRLLNAFPFLKHTISLSEVTAFVRDYYTKVVRDTVTYREKNNVRRNDFLDLLLKIRQREILGNDEEVDTNTMVEDNNKLQKSDLSIEEVTAQCFIFLFAGFETASSTMAFCLFELSQNPAVQERLYQEVKDVLESHNGQLDYEALQEMTYMDQVINETLRLYASLATLDRTCTVPYKIPESDLVLEKGQQITIPIFAIHHDAEFYPNPEQFDPERFSKEITKERDTYVHLPFGAGPRMCIGMRFGIMQTKVGLANLLSTFKFVLSPLTETSVTLSKWSFLTQPEKPIMLHIQERDGVI